MSVSARSGGASHHEHANARLGTAGSLGRWGSWCPGCVSSFNPTNCDPAALEGALALWRGESLEGSDYLWADGEIRSLRATLLDLLERVGRVRLARGDVRGALQMAEQGIALDRLHEPSWRLALQAEHSLGLRESITRRYDELVRALDEQLGLEPARETRVIYRQLGQA